MTTTCNFADNTGDATPEGAKSQRGRAKRLLAFGRTEPVPPFKLRLYTTGERPPSTLVAVPVM